MWTYNHTCDSNELYHYGVKGMKWGVRKSVYKQMNRQERKKARKKYSNTAEGKMSRVRRNALIGTVLTGPVGGVIIGSLTAKKLNIPLNAATKTEEYKKGKSHVNANMHRHIHEVNNRNFHNQMLNDHQMQMHNHQMQMHNFNDQHMQAHMNAVNFHMW